MKSVRDILFDLLQTPSPSGDEERILQKYQSYVAPLVDEVTTDAMGNVIAFKKGKEGKEKRKVMITAHADEVGFMVTYIDKTGYLYFQEIGAIDTNILPEQMVEIHHDGNIVPGVIGKKPLHLQASKEAAKEWEADELWIDIGAKDKAEAEKLVGIGDYVTYQTNLRNLAGGMVTSKGLDDKAGLAALIGIAQRLEGQQLDDDLYLVATVQEELGCRGARTATATIEPDLAIAIDVTHATDYPTVSPNRSGEIKVGGGTVIAKGPNIDKRLGVELIRISNGHCQIEPISHPTGTDANLIQVGGKGVKTALVSIPCRYMHTPHEIASHADIEGAITLVSDFCLKK